MKDTAVLLKEWVIKPKGSMIWRDVPGYEGRYQISNHGDLRSVCEKMLVYTGSSITLITNEETRRQISRRKAVQFYFAPHQRYKEDEFFIDMDVEFYGRYQVSNYGNFKKIKKTVIHPDKAGSVILTKYRGGKAWRENISIVKIFLNTFPPYEVSINEENKTINYKKKYDKFNMPIKATPKENVPNFAELD